MRKAKSITIAWPQMERHVFDFPRAVRADGRQIACAFTLASHSIYCPLNPLGPTE